VNLRWARFQDVQTFVSLNLKLKGLPGLASRINKKNEKKKRERQR